MSNLTIEQVERYRKGCEEPTYWWAPNRSESKALCDLALAALRLPPADDPVQKFIASQVEPDDDMRKACAMAAKATMDAAPTMAPADVAEVDPVCPTCGQYSNTAKDMQITALTARIEQETKFSMELSERIGKDAERIAELEAEIKNLENPPPTPLCGIDGCTREANCGTPTNAGPYVRCCGEHWAKIQEEELK